MHTHKLTLVTTINDPWTNGHTHSHAACECGAIYRPDATYGYPIVGTETVDLMGQLV